MNRLTKNHRRAIKMETKRHFKLYKSGKQWVTAAITTVAVSTGILIGGGSKC